MEFVFEEKPYTFESENPKIWKLIKDHLYDGVDRFSEVCTYLINRNLGKGSKVSQAVESAIKDIYRLGTFLYIEIEKNMHKIALQINGQQHIYKS